MDRILATSVMFICLAGAAAAQTAPAAAPDSTPAAAAPAPAKLARPASAKVAPHKRPTYADRFAAANVTHDGHLTRDQAKEGKLWATWHHFDAIDAGHKGYVTLDDVHAYYAAQAQARKAAKAASPKT